MNNYTIFYELNGKKYKTTVQSANESGAGVIIHQRLIIHKVVKVAPDVNKVFDTFRKAGLNFD